jgi:hypothetical protein
LSKVAKVCLAGDWPGQRRQGKKKAIAFFLPVLGLNCQADSSILNIPSCRSSRAGAFVEKAIDIQR